LRDAIDEQKTFINVYTTGDMERAKIPATLPDDQTVVDRIVGRYGTRRWMFIPNTLHLDHLYVSADLRDEIEASPNCTIEGEPFELAFRDGRHQLPF
jgi:hypothetical protein